MLLILIPCLAADAPSPTDTASALARSLAALPTAEAPPDRFAQLQALAEALAPSQPPSEPPARIVQGNALDAAGRGVAGLTLLASPVENDCPEDGMVRCNAEDVLRTVTDSEGRFELELPSGQRFGVAGTGKKRWGQAILGPDQTQLELRIRDAHQRLRFTGPVPTTLVVHRRDALRLPGVAEIWLPENTRVGWWGGGSEPWIRPVEGKVSVTPTVAENHDCALAETPETWHPCLAFPPTPGLDERQRVEVAPGKHLLYADPGALELGVRVLAARPFVDPPVSPQPVAARRADDPPANLLQDPAVETWRAVVATEEGAEVWTGTVDAGPPRRAVVAERRPRPQASVTVVDPDGTPAPSGVVFAWDPYLRRVETVTADAGGRAVVPTEAGGKAWLAHSPVAESWTETSGDRSRWVMRDLDTPPPGASLQGTWRRGDQLMRMDDEDEARADRIAEGLWWQEDSTGRSLWLVTAEHLVVVADEIERFERVSAEEAAALDDVAHRTESVGPFAGLPVVDHQALDVRKRQLPHYPEGASALGLGPSRCTVWVAIDSTGTPTDLEISGCSRAFHASLREAILQWRWHAPSAAGEPTGVQTRLHVHFKVR